MPIDSITSLDLLAGAIDFGFLLLAFGLYTFQGNTMKKCRGIEIQNEQLDIWRGSLYASMFSIWGATLLMVVYPIPLRFMLHGIFVTTGIYMLHISVPAYVCKLLGYGGTCNCDFYKYNDFTPMVTLGTTGVVFLVVLPVSDVVLIGIFVALIAISISIMLFLPDKEVIPLKYPSNLLLEDIDQLQEFLMSDPHKKKLVTVIDASCDFCEIQIEEILRLPQNILNEQLRIYDMTFQDFYDPILPMTLNITQLDNLPVPTSFVFDAGMVIEQKDGVMSTTEIQMILH